MEKTRQHIPATGCPLEYYFLDFLVVFFVVFLAEAFFAVAIFNNGFEQIFDSDVTKNIGN